MTWRSQRTARALLAAFVLSGGCTWVLARQLAHQAAAASGRRAMLPYASVTRPVAAGEVLKAGDVREIDWPAVDAVDGALERPAEAVGRVALYPLAPGQVVLERSLSTPGSGAGLAGRIPRGMRAIALKSDEVVGVAGFLSPGSHVDVLVTYRDERSAEAVTATVLEDAEVVAAGQQTEPDPAGKAVAATVVTLVLTPPQAERALLASSQGSIHFVLRNSADVALGQSAPVALSELAPVPAPRSVAAAAIVATAGRMVPVAVPRKAVVEDSPATRQPGAVEIVLGGSQPGGGR